MTLNDIAAVPHAVWLGVAAVLGLVFGSFVTAVSYRLPRGQEFVNARSRCPACGTTLSARDLVPVLSWAVTGGCCRVCKSTISARYPLTEIIMAALFVSAVWREQRVLDLALLLAAAVPMMTLSIIDLETRKLPLSLIAVLAGLGAVLQWRGGGDVAGAALLAAGVTALGLALAAATRAWLGRPVIGAGDVYALGAAVLAVPAPLLPILLGLAGGLGLLFGLGWRWLRGEAMYPFAPALFTALWLTWLFGENWVRFLPPPP